MCSLVKNCIPGANLPMFSDYDNGMDIDSPMRPAAVDGIFMEMYRCQPPTALPQSNPLRETLDYCGKIILPQSALEQLSNYNIGYPMVFKLVNNRTGRQTHCGVLEFSAREGLTYLPGWLMETLDLKAGDFVQVSNRLLPSGALIKIQPQSPDFLDISDPRAVLEFTLRQFTTLSPNDCFWINYIDQIYKIKVLETQPNADGILVIETDLNVDFAPPVGYVEPQYNKAGASQTVMAKSIASSIKSGDADYFLKGHEKEVFRGEGHSLRSSPHNSGINAPQATPVEGLANRPAPLRLPKNIMFFGFNKTVATSEKDNVDTTASGHFKGTGTALSK